MPRKINLPGMRLPSEMRTRNKQLVRFKGREEYEAMQGAADELGVTQNEFCLMAIAEKVAITKVLADPWRGPTQLRS